MLKRKQNQVIQMKQKNLKGEWNDNIKQIQEELREMVSGLKSPQKSPQKEVQPDEDNGSQMNMDEEIKEEEECDIKTWYESSIIAKENHIKPQLDEVIKNELDGMAKTEINEEVGLEIKDEENKDADIPKEEGSPGSQRRSTRKREARPIPVSEKKKAKSKKVKEIESKLLADEQSKEEIKSEEIAEIIETPTKQKAAKKKGRGRPKGEEKMKTVEKSPTKKINKEK